MHLSSWFSAFFAWMILVASVQADAAAAHAPAAGISATASLEGGGDEPEKRGPACSKCKSEGSLPCPKHSPSDCALEHGVLFCSFVADCETCAGTAWVDCEKCENPHSEGELERRRLQVVASRETLQYYDDEMGRKLQKGESEHFVLVWELDSLKVGRRRLNAHQLLHLYLGRLEQLYADYCKYLVAGDADFAKKSDVFVWAFPQDQMEGSLRFCMNAGGTGVKLLGSTPRYSVCGNRQNFRGDEDLHRNLMHNVGHLLLSHQRPSRWIGNTKGGWADAGLAHWFEELYFGVCTNYCYQEQNSMVDFRGGKYRVAVRKMVAMGKQSPVAEVFAQNTDTLTPAQHAVSFSYVDYLLHLDGEKTNALMRMLRRKIPTRDALKEHFDLNPLQFEEQWRAWVLETYPVR